MIYVLHGENIPLGRNKLEGLIESLLKKRPGATVFRLQPEDVSIERLEELSGVQGLFEAKNIIVLSHTLGTAEAKEIIFEELKTLAASENLFLLFEEPLDAKTVSVLEKHAHKVESYSKAPKKAAPEFNRFALTDALLKRDRKALWVLYQRAKLSGIADEEIHGLLFWQLKTALLAAKSKSAEDSGLKPFVYSKGKGMLKSYSLQELEALSGSMIDLYHGARRGIHDFDTALERWVLGV